MAVVQLAEVRGFRQGGLVRILMAEPPHRLCKQDDDETEDRRRGRILGDISDMIIEQEDDL